MGGGADELTTEECHRLIDQIAEVNRGTLLVITGGEPLIRPDILDIARYAVSQGLMVVFGTNGMMIRERVGRVKNRKRLTHVDRLQFGLPIGLLYQSSVRQCP